MACAAGVRDWAGGQRLALARWPLRGTGFVGDLTTIFWWRNLDGSPFVCAVYDGGSGDCAAGSGGDEESKTYLRDSVPTGGCAQIQRSRGHDISWPTDHDCAGDVWAGGMGSGSANYRGKAADSGGIVGRRQAGETGCQFAQRDGSGIDDLGGVRGKPPDPRVMEAIGIAHYVAAYGERRAVVLNWDGGKNPQPAVATAENGLFDYQGLSPKPFSNKQNKQQNISKIVHINLQSSQV